MARRVPIKKWLEQHGEKSSCRRGAPVQYELQSKATKTGRKDTYVVETCFNKRYCKADTFRTIGVGKTKKKTLRLLCCTKSHDKKDKCPVSQETQHVLHPVAKFKRQHPAIWKELQRRGGSWKTGARTRPVTAPKRRRRRK